MSRLSQQQIRVLSAAARGDLAHSIADNTDRIDEPGWPRVTGTVTALRARRLLRPGTAAHPGMRMSRIWELTDAGREALSALRAGDDASGATGL